MFKQKVIMTTLVLWILTIGLRGFAEAQPNYQNFNYQQRVDFLNAVHHNISKHEMMTWPEIQADVIEQETLVLNELIKNSASEASLDAVKLKMYNANQKFKTLSKEEFIAQEWRRYIYDMERINIGLEQPTSGESFFPKNTMFNALVTDLWEPLGPLAIIVWALEIPICAAYFPFWILAQL